jgi:flagellar hook-associated protein 1 FlgK
VARPSRFGGLSFAITGHTGHGDQFTVGPNTSGTGDNRNAQLLAGSPTRTWSRTARRRSRRVRADGRGHRQHRARGADRAATREAALLDQTKQAQQQVSGVNLDEEAAALQRYQQAYQASSKVLAIANTLFDSILNIVNN